MFEKIRSDKQHLHVQVLLENVNMHNMSAHMQRTKK